MYLNFNKYVYTKKLNDKMTNSLMSNGHKFMSEKLFKLFLKKFYKNYNKELKFSFKHHIKKTTYSLGVKIIKNNLRIFKEIPFFFRKRLKIALAIKLIENSLKKLKNQQVSEKLLNLLINNLKNISFIALEKKKILQFALIKKTQAHFRWF